MRHVENGEAGFTILEVAIASVISTVGLVFLATLFTLGIAQNRMVKQYTTATSLAQQKLEEINAVERTDTRLTVGGGLAKDDTDPKQTGYYDTVYVNPETGTVTNVIPQGATPIYDRYWKVENDPSFNNTRIISVRVTARQPTVGRKSEETTLTTVRSW
jgi:type II secretory pathway pseudopilin PulG